MWPKYKNYYLHSDDDGNRDWAESLELSEEAIEKIDYLGYEVEFRLQINEDGTHKVLMINGIDISDKNVTI